MNSKEIEQQMIENYQRDEQMMILVFAQWCINHELDPVELYNRAYPQQTTNSHLQQALELTVSKDEAGEIPDHIVLGMMSSYGNEDLAMVINDEINQRIE